ncbi:MAG: hypothetical protein WCP10_09595 [Desulfuromonadales bacterium]
MSQRYFLLLSLGMLFIATVSGAEEELDARTSMKVNRAKRHKSIEEKVVDAVVQPDSQTRKKGTESDPCAGVSIGNVYTDRNRGATPRENTVVVTGDVINVPSNKCR